MPKKIWPYAVKGSLFGLAFAGFFYSLLYGSWWLFQMTEFDSKGEALWSELLGLPVFLLETGISSYLYSDSPFTSLTFQQANLIATLLVWIIYFSIGLSISLIIGVLEKKYND